MVESRFIDTLPKLPGPELMRLWDQAAIDFGIPGAMLMENAGQRVAEAASRLLGDARNKPIWLFMGSGNNGGDAACAARHLLDHGADPTVFHAFPIERMRGDSAWHVELAKKDGVGFIEFGQDDFNEATCIAAIYNHLSLPPALVVDGLLGTGFHGSLKPEMAILVRVINRISEWMRCRVLAIDIPSGLDAKTGTPMPVAVKADLTATLAAVKPGLVLPASRQWTGPVLPCNIGMPRVLDRPADWRLLDGSALLKKEPLPTNSYKNIYGHVYVIGGRSGYEGAAHLACAAALRAGAGLVTACAPKASLSQIRAGWPEIMTLALSEGANWPAELSVAALKALKRADAIVIGPGLGLGEDSAAALEAVLRLPDRPPAVIDADALTLIAQNRDLLELTGPEDIFTPHPGEAARLLNLTSHDVQRDRFLALGKLMDLAPGAFALKGACTLLGQKDAGRVICPYDIPQLAIAGAGDVLAGSAGAFLANRELKDEAALDVASRAVILHAMAGLSLADNHPNRGILASDLASALANACGFIRHKAEEAPEERKYAPWPPSP